MSKTVATRMTLDDWRAEALRRGGGSFLRTPFECPLCHIVSTPQDFKDAGAPPDKAPTNCIGRYTGAKGGLGVKVKRGETMPQPCDWAAYGLFGTLDSGVCVVHPDGHEQWVFSFGPEEGS